MSSFTPKYSKTFALMIDICLSSTTHGFTSTCLMSVYVFGNNKIPPPFASFAKFSAVKRLRSLARSSVFEKFPTLAMKRYVAALSTPSLMPWFWILIKSMVGISAALFSPKKSLRYCIRVMIPQYSSSTAVWTPHPNS